jgi:hypothetical protein
MGSGLSSAVAQWSRRMFDGCEPRHRSTASGCLGCHLPKGAIFRAAPRDCGGREAGWFSCRGTVPNEISEPQRILRPWWIGRAQHRFVYLYAECHCRSCVQDR